MDLKTRKSFFLVSFLASESWCFEISRRTTINLEVFCCSNSSFLINEDLVFSIRKRSQNFSLLWEYTGEIKCFSVFVGFSMVPKTVRTLFASKLLLVHTFFLRYCILYFSDEVVSRKFFCCGENINPKTNRFCCLRNAGTLIDQNFQNIAEVFQKFPLFQLIVLGNHLLKILHQSFNRNIQTLNSAFHSKLSFWTLFIFLW